MDKLPAIMLAAGLSTRMGAFKPLLRLGKLTLIEHALRALHSSDSISEVLVVTGHRSEEIRNHLDGRPGTRIVVNDTYDSGEMISSVQRGISAFPPESPAFLLTFADQPRVQPQTISSLVHSFFKTKPPLVLPTHAGKRGHPIVISTALAPEILALRNPETLKTVVQRHLPSALMLPVPDPTVLEDFDTPEDFQKALKYEPHSPS